MAQGTWPHVCRYNLGNSGGSKVKRGGPIMDMLALSAGAQFGHSWKQQMVNMKPCHLKEGVGPYEQANEGCMTLAWLIACADATPMCHSPIASGNGHGASGRCLGIPTVGLKSVASPPIHTYGA